MHNSFLVFTPKNLLTTLLVVFCLTACKNGNSSQSSGLPPTTTGSLNTIETQIAVLADTTSAAENHSAEKKEPTIDSSWEALLTALPMMDLLLS